MFLPGIPEFSFELDSVKTWRVTYFWLSIFFLLFSIACVIVGLFGLFFL